MIAFGICYFSCPLQLEISLKFQWNFEISEIFKKYQFLFRMKNNKKNEFWNFLLKTTKNYFMWKWRPDAIMRGKGGWHGVCVCVWDPPWVRGGGVQLACQPPKVSEKKSGGFATPNQHSSMLDCQATLSTKPILWRNNKPKFGPIW